MENFTIRISKEDYEKLTELARKHGLSRAEYIRRKVFREDEKQNE